MERTEAQAEQHNRYMAKLQEIKVRFPKEQYSIIKEYATEKGYKSINKFIMDLIKKEIGEEKFPTLREQNKINKENLTNNE